MPLITGTRLGPYQITGPLGAGGMGEVYRARDSRLQRDVAVKVLPSEFAGDPDRLRRFEQEARAVGQLNHPNIVAVYDVGAVDDGPYVVTELLQGSTLREKLTNALPLKRTLDYAKQIAQGLAAAHAKDIVHRDVKPENLFVTTEGRVKLLDFGLAKLHARPEGRLTEFETKTVTVENTILGTVQYMAPEQVRGQAVDARTDIFAFGVVLYEMLTGARPFERSTPADTMSAILSADPPDMANRRRVEAVPPTLAAIVARCLDKDPTGRFQSASDLAFALGSIDTTTASGAHSSVVRARGVRWLWLNGCHGSDRRCVPGGSLVVWTTHFLNDRFTRAGPRPNCCRRRAQALNRGWLGSWRNRNLRRWTNLGLPGDRRGWRAAFVRAAPW